MNNWGVIEKRGPTSTDVGYGFMCPWLVDCEEDNYRKIYIQNSPNKDKPNWQFVGIINRPEKLVKEEKKPLTWDKLPIKLTITIDQI